MKKRRLLVGALALTALLGVTTVGCDNKNNPVGTVLEIKIAAEKTLLEVGESLTLTVKTENLEDEAVINWYSTDTSVLSVTQNGKVIALKEGKASVYAESNGVKSNEVSFTVNAKKVTKLTLKEFSESSIEVGETIKVNLEVENGSASDVTFVLSDPSLGKIDKDLNFVALKEGVCKIYAQLGEVKSNEISITILQQSSDLSLTLDCSDDFALLKGSELKINAKVKGNINNYPLVFKSLNTNVVSITEEGLLKALNVGEASVEVSVGHVKKVLSVQVIEKYDKATSVSYASEEISVAVGEKFELKGVKVLPKTAKQEFTLESSNELFVTVEGNMVVGKQLTKEPVNVVIKADEATFKLKVNVINPQEKYNSYLINKLETSKANEMLFAKSGNLSVTTVDKSNVEKSKTTYDYVAYSDNRVLTKTTNKSSYTDSKSSYLFANYNGEQIKGQTKYNNPDVMEYTSTKVGENSLTEELLNESSTMAYVGYPAYFGFSNYVRYTFFTFSTLNSNNIDEGSYTFNETSDGDFDKVEVSASVTSSYGTRNKYSLTMNFKDDLIQNFEATIEKYREDSYDYDSPSTYVLNETTYYKATLNVGEKEAPTSDLVDFGTFYATSFDVISKAYRDRTYVETNEFNIGESVYLELSNVLPSTYNEDVDKVEFEFVGGEDYIKKAYWGNTFSFVKPVQNYKILVKTKNYSKEVLLNAVTPRTTKISYSGSSYLFSGEAYSSKVTYSPSEAAVKFSATLSENTSEATIDVKEDGSFTLKATKAGSVKVTFKEAISGLTYDKIFYSYDKTDESILDMIFNSNISIETGYTTYIKGLSFTKDEGSNSGRISFTYEDVEMYDEYSISSKWTFKDGKFVFSDASGNYVSKIEFTDSRQDKLKVTFKYDGYYSDSFKISLNHK